MNFVMSRSIVLILPTTVTVTATPLAVVRYCDLDAGGRNRVSARAWRGAPAAVPDR